MTVDDVGNETRGGFPRLCSTAATIGGSGGVPSLDGAISFALSRMSEQRERTPRRSNPLCFLHLHRGAQPL